MSKTTVVIMTLALIGCGPGRQASWEKQASQRQLAPTQSAAPASTEASATEDPAAPSVPLAQQAQAAWAERGERANLDRAISLWSQYTSGAGANDAAALTNLSRAYYLLADGHLRAAGKKQKMLDTFELGITTGERAMMATSADFTARVTAGEKVEDVVQLIPDSGQAAIYWYATNLGKFAAAKGFTKIVFYKERIFAVMQRVLAIDETFFHGAPHRYLGAFYAKAPSFAGGDMTKSKDHFERALVLDPNYLGTKVLYAEYWAAKADDKALFTKLLNEVKAADPQSLPQLVPEQTIEQKKAVSLLQRTDELF